MKSEELTKKPIYAELQGDKARVMEDNSAFVKLDGGKEFSSKLEAGNKTLFDILSYGKKITEREYNA